MIEDFDMDDDGEFWAIAVILQLLIVCWKPIIAVLTGLVVVIIGAGSYVYFTYEPNGPKPQVNYTYNYGETFENAPTTGGSR